MSNDNGGENPPHRKSEGSAARALRGGVVGPKLRARAVGDGHAVDIRRPHSLRLNITGPLRGMLRGETSAVHAGRELCEVNPVKR